MTWKGLELLFPRNIRNSRSRTSDGKQGSPSLPRVLSALEGELASPFASNLLHRREEEQRRISRSYQEALSALEIKHNSGAGGDGRRRQDKGWEGS